MRRKLYLMLMLIGLVTFSACGKNEDVNTNTDVAEKTTIENDVDETEPVETEPEETISKIGARTLEECQDNSLYVLYPDNSLDVYRKGDIYSWGTPNPMTWGVDYYNISGTVIDSSFDMENGEKMKNGELVLFCSNDTGFKKMLYPVEEAGYVMHRQNNEEGCEEAVFLYNNGTVLDDPYVNLWRPGYDMTRMEISTINGQSWDTYPISAETEEQRYATMKYGDSIKLGMIEGTKIAETEYKVDYSYFLSGENEPIEFEMIPTVEGYAKLDFSNVPEGDYILIIEWLEKRSSNNYKRHAFSTHIKI